MRKIMNLSNVLGTIALLSIIALFAALESGRYVFSVFLFVLFFICIFVSRTEDGEHIKRGGRRY